MYSLSLLFESKIYARFLLQVYPRAKAMILTPCDDDLSITTFNITPTIPARRDYLEQLPKISFWIPPEIQLVNRNQCQITLEGTKSILLEVKPRCPAPKATEGLKAIVPHFSDLHRSHNWSPNSSLPTIWVCRQQFQ